MDIRNGYFLLADISGFTSFIAGSELGHSKLILNDILNHLIKIFTPEFSLIEVEGDAVFVYAPVEKFSRGELILEMIEASYFSFRDMKATNQRLATCSCNACRMIKTLDLKFVVHTGEFVLSDVADKAKPMGTSVNIVHRLLKNKVSSATGWKAYALFTNECLERMGLDLPDTHSQIESYEHIGDIKTSSINLDKKYNEFIENRKSFISKEDADYVIGRNYSVAPQTLWEWANNPTKRSKWLEVTDWRKQDRPMGRTGKGATNHCANSGVLERLLDYRPFDYYTSALEGGFIKILITGKFEPVDGGTNYSWYVKLNRSYPKWIRKYICGYMLKRGLKIDKAMERLSELLNEEMKISY